MDGSREEEGTTEDEMAGWHHRLDGRESEWTPGDGDVQGGLACCSPWGRKESDTAERLNTNLDIWDWVWLADTVEWTWSLERADSIYIRLLHLLCDPVHISALPFRRLWSLWNWSHVKYLWECWVVGWLAGVSGLFFEILGLPTCTRKTPHTTGLPAQIFYGEMTQRRLSKGRRRPGCCLQKPGAASSALPPASSGDVQ